MFHARVQQARAIFLLAFCLNGWLAQVFENHRCLASIFHEASVNERKTIPIAEVSMNESEVTLLETWLAELDAF